MLGGEILKICKILTVLLCMAFLIGCQTTSVQETNAQPGQDVPTFTSMEQEAVLTYKVPESIPGILVNQHGYYPGSTKVAIFNGREMPEVFRVINAESGRCVYTGRPEEQGYDNVKKEYTCYGDF